MSNYGKAEARKKIFRRTESTSTGEIQYTGNINDIIDMVVPDGGVAPKNEIPSQEYLPVDLDASGVNWTIYKPQGIKVWRDNGVNVTHRMRMVSFYKNNITIVENEYQTAVLRKGFKAKLTQHEQDLIKEGERNEVQRMENQKITEYIRANDLAAIFLDAAEGRTSREETLAALSAAELPAHKKAEQIVDGANGGAQGDDATVTVGQLKDVMASFAEQFAQQQSQFLRSLQGPKTRGRGHGKNPNQSQNQNQPSPDDFDDAGQGQDQSQGQQPATADDFPFTLDANGCIPGLDKKATAGILQQYEAAKKQSASKGGNA